MTEESTKIKSSKHILKSRDDRGPVGFETVEDNEKFKLDGTGQCSWAKLEEPFDINLLRARIEPWLTALFQSEHLSLLIGSGLTHAVHGMATEKQLPGMNPIDFKNFNHEITSKVNQISDATERKNRNFEDQIRVANELLGGLEILALKKEKEPVEQKQALDLKNELNDALRAFADSILKGERNLVSACSKEREQAFNYLVSFLMSFASRSGTRDRLQIFTTNYDRFIEAGADVAGLRLIDRFVGTLAPVFRASRLDVDLHYNPPGIRGEPRYLEGVARFTKLHGSVDWIDYDGAIRRIGLPLGAREPKIYLTDSGLGNTYALQLMIYPNAAKDRETAFYPYVELFRDLAASICRPNHTLVSYGYSFGDDHINRVIEDMLTIPSTHLVIIAYDDPHDRIMDTYRKLGKDAQISLMIGKYLGDLATLVDRYLPKPAIDRATIRMAKLLKDRLITPQGESDTHENSTANDGDLTY